MAIPSQRRSIRHARRASLVAFLVLSLTACAHDASRPSIRSGAGGNSQEDIKPAAIETTACAQSNLLREEAVAIALETAGREGFAGADGESEPHVEGAWFMSDEEMWQRFEIDMGWPTIECVWYVSMSGQGFAPRYPPGASPSTPPIVWTSMTVTIDDSTGFASGVRQSMGQANDSLPPLVERGPRPVLTLEPMQPGPPPPTPGGWSYPGPPAGP